MRVAVQWLRLGVETLGELIVAQGTVLVGNKAQDANTVTIISTQYGMLPEYRIPVSPSRQITSTIQPLCRGTAILRENRMTVFNRQQFFPDLTRAGSLNALPTGAGQHSMAGRPGRRRRQQTPDLRMVSSSTGRLLHGDATKIMWVSPNLAIQAIRV